MIPDRARPLPNIFARHFSWYTRMLVVGLHRRFHPQRPERSVYRGTTSAQRARPWACRWMVSELVQARNSVLAARRGRTMALPNCDRQARSTAKHAIEALRARRRKLAHGQRREVVAGMCSTL